MPYTTYSPSLIEIGIVIVGVCRVPLAYSLAERFLDLSSPGGSGDVHGVRASGARAMVRRSLGGAR